MERPLRIGVNALYLIPGGVGGTEIYLRGLLAALARLDPVNRYYVLTNRETGPDLVPESPNFVRFPQRVRARLRPARIVWEQSVLPFRASRLGFDVLLNPGFTAPLLAGCPQVTVFHDLQHKRHPGYFRWFDLPFWQFLLYWSARRSRLLVAVSECTAADLDHYYHLPPGKVRVVPLGVDPEFASLAARRAPEPFILAVSTLHPHKNLDGLLQAFAAFRRTHPEFRMVVSGLHGFAARPLHELRDKLGLSDAVEFPGWIPRNQLHDLYRRAWAFLYPTRFEGFGLPVLEAMAAGIPTACSDIPPLAAISADGALRFDPERSGALLEALTRICCDMPLREALAVRGPAQAAHFSWDATAAGTLQVLREAAR
jgi:glycosyltransferase involved in cell wall biosynthesis